MRHYLFECTDGNCEGKEFIVGANAYAEARHIAEDNFIHVRYIYEMSDFEAEVSGLDEY